MIRMVKEQTPHLPLQADVWVVLLLAVLYLLLATSLGALLVVLPRGGLAVINN